MTNATRAPVTTVATPTANAVLLRPRILLSLSSTARDVVGARAMAIVRQATRMKRIIDPAATGLVPGNYARRRRCRESDYMAERGRVAVARIDGGGLQ